MNIVIAETPEQVRTWVETFEHHQGRWLNKNKEDVLHPLESAFFELSGYHEAILIPVAIHEECPLKVVLDGKRMFGWDFAAEKRLKAPVV
jgi:hypothetical protein